MLTVFIQHIWMTTAQIQVFAQLFGMLLAPLPLYNLKMGVPNHDMLLLSCTQIFGTRRRLQSLIEGYISGVPQTLLVYNLGTLPPLSLDRIALNGVRIENAGCVFHVVYGPC